MGKSKKDKTRRFDLVATAQGGFDQPDHLCVIIMERQTWELIKKHAKYVKDNPGLYGVEMWFMYYTHKHVTDDDGNPQFPENYDDETVRSECQLMRIMDNEVLFTHFDKYVEGVSWETEDLPLTKIAEAFGEQWP